jgi:hypothetical protein
MILREGGSRGRDRAGDEAGHNYTGGRMSWLRVVPGVLLLVWAAAMVLSGRGLMLRSRESGHRPSVGAAATWGGAVGIGLSVVLSANFIALEFDAAASGASTTSWTILGLLVAFSTLVGLSTGFVLAWLIRGAAASGR